MDPLLSLLTTFLTAPICTLLKLAASVLYGGCSVPICPPLTAFNFVTQSPHANQLHVSHDSTLTLHNGNVFMHTSQNTP